MKEIFLPVGLWRFSFCTSEPLLAQLGSFQQVLAFAWFWNVLPSGHCSFAYIHLQREIGETGAESTWKRGCGVISILFSVLQWHKQLWH